MYIVRSLVAQEARWREVLTIPVTSSKPRVLGGATAAVVWFSSPFFPMYVVPQLRLVKSFIDLVYVLDEDSRRGLSNQILAALEKVASLSNVLQWPALAFWVRSSLRLPTGFPVSTRWLRGDKKWVTPDWDSEPRVLGGLTVHLLCCFREVLTIPAIG